MGVTVTKCHMIMSGNDCWNSVRFSCCRKADNESAGVTLSGRLFQNCAAALPSVADAPIVTLEALLPYGGTARRAICQLKSFQLLYKNNEYHKLHEECWWGAHLPYLGLESVGR